MPAHTSSHPMQVAAMAYNRTLTWRLFAGTVVSGLVVILGLLVMLALSWEEMMRSDDPLAGLGLLIALIVGIPFVVGMAVSAVGLIWRTRAAGPIIAGIGLGINGLALLLAAWFFLPSFYV